MLTFFQNHDQIRSPWNNCWIFFVWFMVFLCVSLDEFVLMVRAARIISRKVGKEDRAEWYQQFYDAWWRSSDFQGSKGPSCSQPPVFFTHCKGSSLKPSKLRFLIYKWDLTWSSIGFLGMDSEAIWGIPILQDVVIVVASSLPKPCILGRCLPMFGFKTASVWAYQVWTDCVGKFHGGWLGGL